MKRIAAVIMALLMVIGVSATAFAEETYTITVTDNRTYEVYQIFTGDLSESTLSNVKWGKNGTGTKGEAVDKSTLAALTEVTSSTNNTAKLAVIENYVNFTSEKFGTVSNSASLTVPAGYYLLKDVSDNLADGHEKSIYVVKIVGDLTVQAKAGEVTSEKKVKETNDSTGATTDWQDSASYDIGDDVPFKLSATITAQYANYEHYYLAFHDTLSAGLSFNEESVVVKIDGTTVTSGYTLVTEGLTDGCTFEVVFNDLTTTVAHAESVITVEYTAELTEGAVVGSTGNDNKLKVEYSNNPNSDYDGKGNPEDTGETPEDKVVVFTYKLVVNKVDQDNNALKGAGFTLYKKIKDDNETLGYKWEAVGEEIKGTNLTTFTWSGLDNGDYKLVETTTPAGYNTMADIEFTITDTVSDKLELTALVATANNQNWITGTPADGKLEASIVNNKGTILPETGAQGTMMFITFGSLIAVAAVVLMVTRKKMSVYED